MIVIVVRPIEEIQPVALLIENIYTMKYSENGTVIIFRSKTG